MASFSPFLDEISENILYLLSLDSRLQTTQMARILGVSRRIVENRVEKLRDEKFIVPLLVRNYAPLIKATVLVKLSKFDEKTIPLLVNLKKTIKLKETLGSYDILFLIVANDVKEYEDFLNLINNTFQNSIQNMDIIMHDKADTMGHKVFCHDKSLLNRYSFLKYNKSHEMTLEELDLINILKVSPNISYQELMNMTGFNFKKIKDMMESLVDNNAVRFTTDSDYQKMGIEFHNVLVKINLAKYKEFEKYCLANKNIHWLKRGSGSWNYILSIAARNINDFIVITRELRTQNKNIIMNFSTLISNIHIEEKNNNPNS